MLVVNALVLRNQKQLASYWYTEIISQPKIRQQTHEYKTKLMSFIILSK